jgi:hypothetical protein
MACSQLESTEWEEDVAVGREKIVFFAAQRASHSTQFKRWSTSMFLSLNYIDQE